MSIALICKYANDKRLIDFLKDALNFPMNELPPLELAAAKLKAEVIADGAFTVR